MEHYTIELPRGIWNFFKRQNLKRRLRNKLIQYLDRASETVDTKNRDRLLDTLHKMAVLEELLDKNRIDTATLAEKLEQEMPIFSWILFERACDVIRAYCEGINPKALGLGGTGLPK